MQLPADERKVPVRAPGSLHAHREIAIFPELTNWISERLGRANRHDQDED